jgi:sec-independent protein translocase protein TatC
MQMTFWEHCDDLRRTLIRVFITIVLGSFVALMFNHAIFSWLTYPANNLKQFPKNQSTIVQQPLKHLRIINQSDKPLTYQLPENANLSSPILENVHELTNRKFLLPPQAHIDIQQPETEQFILLGPIEGTLLSLKVAFWFGLVGTSPIWLWFITRFISPAIGMHVKQYLIPFLTISIIFMLLGFLFAFFLTIPIANQFLYSFNSEIGRNFWTLNHYIDYTVLLMLAHGLAFELFIVLLFLIHFGILSAESLSEKRRYAIIGAFILGAIFTPPDIFTQILLAIPLIGFYELAICYALWRKKIHRGEKFSPLFK